MENGKFYIEKGIFYVYDTELYIGMPYSEMIEQFKEDKKSKVKNEMHLRVSGNIDINTIWLQVDSIYDCACILTELTFDHDVLTRIEIQLSTVQMSTQEISKVFVNNIKEQYELEEFEWNNITLFSIIKNKFRLYSSTNEDGITYIITLDKYNSEVAKSC